MLPRFAQGIVDSHAGDLVPDDRFQDTLESAADCGQGLLGFREIKICRRFPGIGDAPDGKAGDFDSLILGGDLVGPKLDRLCRGGNDRIAVNPWQFKETDAPPKVTDSPHSLVNHKFGKAGIDDPDGFNLFVFHNTNLSLASNSG